MTCPVIFFIEQNKQVDGVTSANRPQVHSSHLPFVGCPLVATRLKARCFLLMESPFLYKSDADSSALDTPSQSLSLHSSNSFGLARGRIFLSLRISRTSISGFEYISNQNLKASKTRK